MTVLVGISGAFLTGLFVSSIVKAPLLFSGALGALGVAAALMFPRRLLALLIFGSFFLGVVTGEAEKKRANRCFGKHEKPKREKNVSIFGRISSLEARLGGGYRIVLQGVWIEQPSNNGWKKLSGKAQVNVFTGQGHQLQIGTQVRTKGVLEPFHYNRLHQRSLLRLGVNTGLWVSQNVAVVRFVENSVSLDDIFRSQILRLRRSFERQLLALPNHRGRDFLWGLLLGPSSTLPWEMRKDFNALGLSHLLAISGLHMAILGGMVFFFFSFLLKSLFPFLLEKWAAKQLAAAVTLPFLLIYWAVVGDRPSTTRALVMLGAYFTAHLFARPSSVKDALALAVLGLLSWHPGWIQSPGFQLSFVTVACLCVGGEIFSSSKKEDLLFQGQHNVWKKLILVFTNLLWVSVVAGFATIGLVAFHFGRVSFWGLLVNLVAVPVICWVLLPLAFGSVVAGLFWPGLGNVGLSFATSLAFLCVEMFEWMAAFMAIFHIYGEIRHYQVVFYYLTISFLALWKHPSTSWRIGLWGAAVSAVCLFLTLIFPFQGKPEDPSFTFINLGRGEAILVELPSGHNILVDTGEKETDTFDPCRRILLPLLKRRKVRRLDVLVISHPHMDHMGGAICVMDELEIGELWTNGELDPDGHMFKIIQKAERKQVVVRMPEERHFGETVFYPVHPAGISSGKICANPLLDVNDNSLVLLVKHPNGSVLLAGDVGERAEIILEKQDIRADVLKVPHHGSLSSSQEQFLRAVTPQYAVVCGKKPPPGFSKVEERYKKLGIKLYTTWRDGVVTFLLNRSGVVVK